MKKESFIKDLASFVILLVLIAICTYFFLIALDNAAAIKMTPVAHDLTNISFSVPD